ncbi:MAG: c-type cytochrome [Chloroflexi bacterium]|nr:c-type cytochrome [Chloroflexota bacterium]
MSLQLWLVLVGLTAALFLAACSRSPAPGGIAPTPIPEDATPEMLSRGESLYQANCQSCHGGATGGTMMTIPPPHNANGHTWHHPDCQLTDVVLNGSGEMGEMMRRMMPAPEGTPRMPVFKGTLTEEDIRAILGYIKTWWTEAQRQSQARATEQLC